MKKFILFLIPFFLFAVVVPLKQGYYDCKHLIYVHCQSDVCEVKIADPNIILSSGQNYWESSSSFPSSFFSTGLYCHTPDNIWGPSGSFSVDTFVKRVFNSSAGDITYYNYKEYKITRRCLVHINANYHPYGVNTDDCSVVMCPPGQTFNQKTEECEKNPPKCPDYNTMLNQVASNCAGAQYVKNVECNATTGKITYSCLQCENIKNSLLNKCKSQGKLLTMQCSSSDTFLHFTYNCVSKDKNISNGSDSNSSLDNNNSYTNAQVNCLNSGGNWLCVVSSCQCLYSKNFDSNSSGSGNSNSGNSGSGNSNSGNSGSGNSNSGNSGSGNNNCCYRYNNQQLGDSWILKNGVWIQENSPHCKVVFREGVCSVVAGGGGDSNISGSSLDLSPLIQGQNKISSKIDTVNNNLQGVKREINQTNTVLNTQTGFLKDINKSLSAPYSLSKKGSSLDNALQETKNKIKLQYNNYISSSVVYMPTISVTIFGKKIILLDNSYLQMLPIDLIRKILLFVAAFSGLFICLRTD